MTGWSSYIRHPLVILTLSLLAPVTVAGFAAPWLAAGQGEPGAGGQAVTALPFSGASLTPQGGTLPVSPVVRAASGPPSTEPRVTLQETATARWADAARLKVSVHTVSEGETLGSIAARYRSDVDTLEGLNPDLVAGQLRAGQKIRVMNGRGTLYTMREGETLSAVSKRFWVAEAKILAANGLLSADQIKPGSEIILPGIKPRRRDDYLASRGLGPLYLTWPTRGWLTSRYGMRWGRMHEGIDVAVSTGNQIRAAAPGRVEYAGWRAGYGRLVVLDHGRGIHTRYGHNSRLMVKPGQWVQRGDVIALSGSTGSSTGPHMHFEVRVNGRPQNPLTWLRR